MNDGITVCVDEYCVFFVGSGQELRFFTVGMSGSNNQVIRYWAANSAMRSKYLNQF
jgi:hypothetical protein